MTRTVSVQFDLGERKWAGGVVRLQFMARVVPLLVVPWLVLSACTAAPQELELERTEPEPLVQSDLKILPDGRRTPPSASTPDVDDATPSPTRPLLRVLEPDDEGGGDVSECDVGAESSGLPARRHAEYA